LLAPPWAHLPCVAWENVLQPGLGVPVLRLPTSAVTPVASKTPLEIALCVPDAPEGLEYDAGALLERLIRCTRDAVPASTHLQIFAGPRGRRTAERLTTGEFTVHEPTHAATVPPPEPPPGTAIERGIPGRIDNPWLRWILSTLGDRSVDMIHFATPGFLSATYGALDFGDSPLGLTDERCSRLVTAGELIAMVTRTGAWSLGFTIPQRTGWPAGIRLLAHHIGRLMSGPLIVDAPHYAPTDAPDALEQAYSLLFAPPPVAVPSTPSVTIYVNPGRVREVQGTALAPAEGLFEQQIHDRVGALTLGADATDQTLGGAEEPPAWVAANQRTLERWATVILESEAAGTHREAVVQGLNDALEQVSSILAKYADKPEPPR
jgi:hypothetical protein